jgi:hypothetical protein
MREPATGSALKIFCDEMLTATMQANVLSGVPNFLI